MESDREQAVLNQSLTKAGGHRAPANFHKGVQGQLLLPQLDTSCKLR